MKFTPAVQRTISHTGQVADVRPLLLPLVHDNVT